MRKGEEHAESEQPAPVGNIAAEKDAEGVNTSHVLDEYRDFCSLDDDKDNQRDKPQCDEASHLPQPRKHEGHTRNGKGTVENAVRCVPIRKREMGRHKQEADGINGQA